MNFLPWRYAGKWTCIRCGKCCSELDVPVTYEEELRFRRFGKVLFRKKVGVYLRKVNGRCIFLDENNVCRIYPIRPEACRRYPFYIREKGCSDASFHVGGKVVYVYIDPSCPGIGRGAEIEKAVEDVLHKTYIREISEMKL